jgi:hypothetical protein
MASGEFFNHWKWVATLDILRDATMRVVHAKAGELSEPVTVGMPRMASGPSLASGTFS